MISSVEWGGLVVACTRMGSGYGSWQRPSATLASISASDLVTFSVMFRLRRGFLVGEFLAYTCITDILNQSTG